MAVSIGVDREALATAVARHVEQVNRAMAEDLRRRVADGVYGSAPMWGPAPMWACNGCEVVRMADDAPMCCGTFMRQTTVEPTDAHERAARSYLGLPDMWSAPPTGSVPTDSDIARALLAEYRRLAAGDAATGRTWGDWHAEMDASEPAREVPPGVLAVSIDFEAARAAGHRGDHAWAHAEVEAVVVWARRRAAGHFAGPPPSWWRVERWPDPRPTAPAQPRPPLVADARGAGAWEPPWLGEDGE